MAKPGTAELNATQGSLLGFLHDGPMTGWDLLQQVEGGLARFWNITSSHVYRELRVLEDRRLIKAGPPEARDRVPFTITAAGRRVFAAWIAQPPGPEQIRFPLLVALWFGAHVAQETMAGFLASSTDDHARRLSLYESVAGAASGDPHRDAVIHFGIAYERAVIGWLDTLAADLPTHRPGT